jgi:nicotinamidase/pyrazinamidase
MADAEQAGEKGPKRRFVIVVDTQRDFMDADGALSVSGADALAEPMAQWLAALDPAETAGVLFTFDTHVPAVYAASPEAAQFPPHCVKGTAGWENRLPPALIDPAIAVWRMEKGVFAMWEEPGLLLSDARDPGAPPVPRDAFFADLLSGGVEDVTVIGVAADYCVFWAIEGLVERGFRVSVPAALTRGIARQIDQVATEEFAGRPVAVV